MLVNTASNLTGNGVTFTVNEDKSITTSGTSTADIYYAVTLSTPLSAGEYFLSGMPQGASGMRIYVWPGYYSDMGNGCPFSVEENGMYEAYIHIGSGVNCNGLTFRPQIEVGTSATAYEPYKEQPLTISTPNGLPGIPVFYGGNYTDSNGQQWVCDEIDLAKGVYVQRIYNPNLSTLAWLEGEANHDGDGKIYFAMLSGVIQNALGCMISHFKKSNLPTTAVWEQLAMGEFLLTDHLAVCATPYATLNEFISYLESEKAEAVFALKEPIETALDADTLAAYAALHSNKPNTTVLNDAGAGQKLGYVADTKTYIDQKFTQLQSAIIAAIGTI